MKATWNDSSENESEDDDQGEISYMCYMAINDEVESLDFNDESSDDDFNDLSYDKQLNDFYDLHKNYEKPILKNCALKKKISNFSEELDEFSKEKEVILSCDTYDSLKNENAP